MVRRDRDGLRFARLFRQARALPDEPRACDLRAICEADQIEVITMEHATPGFTACLICPSPDIPCGIALAPGQGPGRRRFSIAHELGHFHMPTHRKRPSRPCRDEDMDARAATDYGRKYEWEANDFAAELLMPKTVFSRDSSGRDPVFREIVELAGADMYDVSRTAAALRYVETTHEACALVCARDGIIEWVSKSQAFGYRIPWKNDPVPPGSISRAVFNGEQPSAEGEAVDPYTWLENKQRRRVEFFESTLAILAQSQVLSLLWVIDQYC